MENGRSFVQGSMASHSQITWVQLRSRVRSSSSPQACAESTMATWWEGGFQTIQGGVASSTERGAASRTSERLNTLGLAMLAIADQGVDLSIGDPEVGALRVGASEPLGVDAFGGSPAVFDLAPGAHRRRR
jgi:hypothetical protein